MSRGEIKGDGVIFKEEGVKKNVDGILYLFPSAHNSTSPPFKKKKYLECHALPLSWIIRLGVKPFAVYGAREP